MQEEKIVKNILKSNFEYLKSDLKIDIDEEFIKKYKLKDKNIKKHRLIKLIDLIVTEHCDNSSKGSRKYARIKRDIETKYKSLK